MTPYRRPAYWVVYLLYVLLVVLLFAQAALPVSTGWHQLLEIGVLGLFLGGLAWWERRNAAALDDETMVHAIEQRAPSRRDTPLTEVQARYLLAQHRHNHRGTRR
jgi:type VI protein secretion system component VasK